MTTTTTILDFAPELLQEVTSYLPKKSVADLREVCRAFSTVVESRALSSLIVQLSLENLAKETEKLEAYASGQSRGAKHVTTITVKSLGPLSAPAAQHRYLTTNSDGSWSRSHTRKPSPELEKAEEQLHELLTRLIPNLTMLKALRWFTSAEDPLWSFEIIQKLIDRHQVDDISIDFEKGTSSVVDLSEITTLRRLELINFERLHSLPLIMKTFSELVAKNLGLQTLAVRSGFCAATERTPSLHDFIRALPPDTHLQIRTLSLNGMRFRPDAVTLPHLRQVKDLSISFNLNTRPLGSQVSDTWPIFQAQGIYLEAISIDIADISHSFLDYIMAYEGLKELKLHGTMYFAEPGSQPEQIADIFWVETLAHLSPKLEVLHIDPGAYESHWAVDSSAIAALSQCKKLVDAVVHPREEKPPSMLMWRTRT